MKHRDLHRLIKSAVGAYPALGAPKPQPFVSTINPSGTFSANNVAKWMAPAPRPTPIQQARANTAAAAPGRIAPTIAGITDTIGTAVQGASEGISAITNTPNNFYRDWFGPRVGAVPDFLANSGKQTLRWANEGINRMGNAGTAATQGNWGTAAGEAGQGMARLGGAALSVLPTGAASGGVAKPLLARVASGVGNVVKNAIPPTAVRAAVDDKGMNAPAPAAPATQTVAQATGKSPQAVAQAAEAAGFDAASFEKMMPFLMAALPMLFGGGAPGSNFSNPNYQPTSPGAGLSAIDRMAASSPFG
jgi:hypothetical protein